MNSQFQYFFLMKLFSCIYLNCKKLKHSSYRQGRTLHLFIFSLAACISFLALRNDKSGKLSTTANASVLMSFDFSDAGSVTGGIDGDKTPASSSWISSGFGVMELKISSAKGFTGSTSIWSTTLGTLGSSEIEPFSFSKPERS